MSSGRNADAMKLGPSTISLSLRSTATVHRQQIGAPFKLSGYYGFGIFFPNLTAQASVTGSPDISSRALA